MKYWTPPVGGLYMGERLRRPPHVIEYALGAPARIVLVTDVHMGRYYPPEAVKRLVDLVNSLSPEILLLGGDYAEDEMCARAFFEEVSRVRTPYGAYAVSGNNDEPLFERDRQAYRALMRDNGVTLLTNEMTRVCVRGRVIELAGVEDRYYGSPDATGLFSEDAGVYRILLTHTPHTFLLEQASPAPDIMLCGHTHGGQINFLGFTCYTLLRYEHWMEFTHIAGRKRVGATDVIVSRGVGVSKYPIRLGTQPEILLIS